MLCRHAVKFVTQLDRYLYGILWAYRNTPHDSTKQNPSYLLFGTNCHTPTEAAFLPEEPMEHIMWKSTERNLYCHYHLQGNLLLHMLRLHKQGTSSSIMNHNSGS